MVEISLTHAQKRTLRALVEFLPRIEATFSRVVMNDRGEVRLEYRRDSGSMGAVAVFPAGDTHFVKRSEGSRSTWRPNQVREIPAEEWRVEP